MWEPWWTDPLVKHEQVPTENGCHRPFFYYLLTQKNINVTLPLMDIVYLCSKGSVMLRTGAQDTAGKSHGPVSGLINQVELDC